MAQYCKQNLWTLQQAYSACYLVVLQNAVNISRRIPRKRQRSRSARHIHKINWSTRNCRQHEHTISYCNTVGPNNKTDTIKWQTSKQYKVNKAILFYNNSDALIKESISITCGKKIIIVVTSEITTKQHIRNSLNLFSIAVQNCGSIINII